MQDTINDDPQLDPPIPFKLGTMAFAGSGPDSRTTQMFIAYGEIPSLGSNPWETPFGVVEDGIDNVIRFHSYGDMAPWGQGPNPHQIMSQGSGYVETGFPLLDKFETCTVERITPSETETEL
uniref:PPIase cyclophilin-type domain-containing protein n=2 Tax=Amphora coffeiformis TaxID=265554 RepID=A0A7S3LJW5_9STRA